jgi:ABC-type glycerol-3-phosphate transport system substrate-binding protein
VAIVCGLCAGVADAGRVEVRADGTTVIHLEVFRLPDAAAKDAFNRADRAVIDEFVKRFPAIFAARYRGRYKANPDVYGAHNWDKVELEVEAFAWPHTPGLDAAAVALAKGTGADVLYVNFRCSGAYIRKGYLYPLDRPADGYLAAMTQNEIDFRVHPKVWPVIRRRGPDGRVGVWAIPYGGPYCKVLLYRKALFDRHGVPYPDEAWTWDDLYAACRKIADPASGIYGFRLGRGAHESWYWMTYLWSAGGEAMAYDEATGRWRFAFDSREAAVALEFYTRLCTEKWIDKAGDIQRGYVCKDMPAATTKWSRGEIAMTEFYISDRSFPKIDPKQVGMAPVPLGPPDLDGQRIRGSELNCQMMGIFAGVRDRAVRDAAWEYIRWFDSREAVRIKTRVMVDAGLGRHMQPKHLRMFGHHRAAEQVPKDWPRVWEIAIAAAQPEPYGSNIAYDLMTPPIQEAEALALAEGLATEYDYRVDLMQELLEKAVACANEELPQPPPPEKRPSRTGLTIGAVAAAGVVILGIALFLIRRRLAGRKAL